MKVCQGRHVVPRPLGMLSASFRAAAKDREPELRARTEQFRHKGRQLVKSRRGTDEAGQHPGLVLAEIARVVPYGGLEAQGGRWKQPGVVDDVEITVPNGLIGNSKIVNETGGVSPRHRIRVAVGVAYGSDLDHVIATLSEVAAAHESVCETPEPRVRFRKFGESSLDFELLCWIDQPVDRGRTLHELNCEVYKKFISEGIEIPLPQRDLHVRTMPQT